MKDNNKMINEYNNNIKKCIKQPFPKDLCLHCRKNKIIARCQGYKATASCNKKDVFDYQTGASLAIKRLIDKIEFVPHIIYNNKSVSIIGDKTEMTDIYGVDLKVGDVVKIFKIKELIEGCIIFERAIVSKDCFYQNGFLNNRKAKTSGKKGTNGEYLWVKDNNYPLTDKQIFGYSQVVLSGKKIKHLD